MKKIFNKQKLNKALKMFKVYSKTDSFLTDIQDRKERREFFLNFKKRKRISEFDFSEIIKKLWAARFWGNKDYLINNILKKNDFKEISKEISYLYLNKGTPGDRYERFLNKIKGMGPSMVTELICHIDPKNAGIWNDKARKALAWLEAEDIPYDTYKITGKEYNKFNNFLKVISDDFKRKNYEDVDLLFVDYFLWEVWERLAKNEKIVEIESSGEIKESTHNELRDKISEIGSWLGFEVETEKLVAARARVDVIWRAKIANLGTVSYVFEVQHRGSIDSLMVNLQKAQKSFTVQKLVIVSDLEQTEKIRKEIEDMPENFRKAVVFWTLEDVQNTHQNLEQVTDSIAKLKLMEE